YYSLDRRIRMSGAQLAELLHATYPPSVTMTRPDPGVTRDVPTIFERVSAGPGEVAHFTMHDGTTGVKPPVLGAISRVATARVDVSAELPKRRPAPWIATGLVLVLAVIGIGAPPAHPG